LRHFNKTSKLLLIALVLLSVYSSAQNQSENKINFGAHIQAYPAGIIPSAHLEWAFSSKYQLHTRLGMNITNRQDFSPYHSHEEGSGFGGSIGLLRQIHIRSMPFKIGVFQIFGN